MGIFVKPLDFLGFHVVHRTINDTIKAFTTNIFKTGILPKHVAFIMDGNRRFAKSNGLDKFEGHEAGSVSLAKIIETSYLLRIKYVTIYAFSIENFNRTKEEVDKLFELLVEKLNLILESEKKFERNKSAQVRIIGNRSFIPSETLEKLEQIERLTKSNDEMVLNVCFSYTSRDEIAHSISQTCQLVSDEKLLISQINEQVLESNFYFGIDIPNVDVLVRTSGHTRLSDFLIWQVNESSSMIEFKIVNWPDFSNYQYYFILLKYGYQIFVHGKLKELKKKYLPMASFAYSERVEKNVDLKKLNSPPPSVSILGHGK